ncbi:methyltransferase domain-containing protein [Magnetovibrio sp. PR-2]|uniref:class I SAM-dependent methyltransferase n=1 Tax=Magnetovibrio sp. PR-2 TaxID=3120356 RepID=UPI002FCE01E5
MTKQDENDVNEDEPYIGFYTKNKISPVHQNISDLEKHFSRRDYLYRTLGVPPYALEGKSVVEFAPGSGHNALYTMSLSPKRYLLVDMNTTGIDEGKALLKEYYPNADCYEFVRSKIQDFQSVEKFDVVICEGAVPNQTDSAAFARHVGSFVKPGGMLVITVCDNVGVLSELIRRLIAEKICPSSEPFDTRLEAVRSIFAPHFEAISGTSRPLDHWLMDNIIQKWLYPVFAVDEAIEALQDAFEVYGTSPQFLTDWRWHKQIHGDEAGLNERAIEQYKVHGISFINGSRLLPPVIVQDADVIRQHAQKIWDYMIEIQDGNTDLWQMVADSCNTIAASLQAYDTQTSEAIKEAAVFFEREGKVDPQAHFDKFTSLFGQGQQYISFVRKRDLIPTANA